MAVGIRFPEKQMVPWGLDAPGYQFWLLWYRNRTQHYVYSSDVSSPLVDTNINRNP
jgi:hypothetical protein